MDSGRKGPFPSHAAALAAVALLGTALAFLATQPDARFPALLGVWLSALGGLAALLLKRLAKPKPIPSALKVLGASFALRLLLAAAGLALVRSHPYAFAAGFFGIYFTLQWVEIGYVLAEQRRGRGG
ncbi:MAG: hypothetical protein HYZ28_20220 [Myxococcales bacterium]|nr:hypothetical protein [Myxococcales bacterium]